MPQCEQVLFWQWSVQRYGSAGVRDACLRLQDQFDLNVNILLLCEFLRQRDIALSARHIQMLVQSIAESDRGLKRHRNKRREAKTYQPEHYKALLEAELSLEQQQQALLVDTLNSLDSVQGDAQNNVLRYVREVGQWDDSVPVLKHLLSAMQIHA